MEHLWKDTKENSNSIACDEKNEVTQDREGRRLPFTVFSSVPFNCCSTCLCYLRNNNNDNRQKTPCPYRARGEGRHANNYNTLCSLLSLRLDRVEGERSSKRAWGY